MQMQLPLLDWPALAACTIQLFAKGQGSQAYPLTSNPPVATIPNDHAICTACCDRLALLKN